LKGKISIGTAQLGLNYGIGNKNGKIPVESFQKIIDLAKQHEISSLDTAMAYGNAEVLLGEIGVQGFNTTTKLSSIPLGDKNIDTWVQDKIETSLANLKQDKLYSVLLHDPTQLTNSKGIQIMKALERAKNKNLMQKIGVSIQNPDDLKNITQNFNIDIIQAPFNILDRRLDQTGWIDKLHNLHIEIHARSIFLQGLLLMSALDIPENFHKWNYLFNKFHRWLEAQKITPYEACLNFALSYKKISKLVIGVDSINQFKILISTLSKLKTITKFPDISSKELNLIDPTRWKGKN
tara:strand:- start:130 stop:1008 length:879 start_codon:yes stop_codon:yes gene_type:complete